MTRSASSRSASHTTKRTLRNRETIRLGDSLQITADFDGAGPGRVTLLIEERLRFSVQSVPSAPTQSPGKLIDAENASV